MHAYVLAFYGHVFIYKMMKNENLVEIQVFVVETTSSFNALLEFINGLLIHEESTVILPLRKEILLIFFT